MIMSLGMLMGGLVAMFFCLIFDPFDGHID